MFSIHQKHSSFYKVKLMMTNSNNSALAVTISIQKQMLNWWCSEKNTKGLTLIVSNFSTISLLKPHTTLFNYFWSRFQMEQMAVNLNKNNKSKNLTHKITMGWTIMINKHSTAYVGFDSLCSNKNSHLYYSEEKRKKKSSLKLQFKNPKYKTHRCSGTSVPPICLGLKHVSHQTEHQLSL